MGVDPSTMVAADRRARGRGACQAPAPSQRIAARARWCSRRRAGALRERGRQMASQVEDEVLGGLTPAQRRELLKLLRLANSTAPAQPPWRAEEGD